MPNHSRTRLHLICSLLALTTVIAGIVGPRALQGASTSQRTTYLPIIRTFDITNDLAIVFVSRQIPANGSIYWDVPKDMPGVGPHSRFRPAAPGKLVVREPDGRLRVLVDGSKPTATSLQLIDVNAPDVSYDGKTIVFAGLHAGSYNPRPVTNPDAWRLYSIRVDGTGLRQITTSDQHLNMAQFGAAGGGLSTYDDGDPAWLPDGRIVFSSTRWPSYAQYSGVRTSNLYIVKADGSGLHRITAERNGADRPLVDPITGKIVYARWWRNHRFALNDMTTIADPNGGYKQKDGLSANRSIEIDGSAKYNDWLWRNAWQAATINPDGTGLAMWGGAFRNEEGNHIYGGAFTANGELIANFFPMYNMAEAGGFGGLRHYHRGPGSYTPIIGVTALSKNYVHPSNPTSYGIFNSAYAADPDVLPDGRLILSWAADTNQDYGLYIANANGSGLTKLYDNPGTTELRARLIRPRPLPPVIPDTITQVPSLLPPPAAGPYSQDGTFVFNALNVYANGPVDADIISAPPVGSADKIRFFIDQQRTSPGSFPNLDWPILLGERQVGPDGSVREPNAPANVPLFEQLRSPNGTVPLTGQPDPTGAAHVAGMNFGRPGAVVRCVGCHAGHTMIPVPINDADAQWSNLAPGAQITVSSSRDAQYNSGLIDRQVMKGEIWRYWTSSPSQSASGQWVQLTFPVPVTVRTVRLYNPRPGDEANSSLLIGSATVRLYSDAAGTQQIASQSAGPLSVIGTDVAFHDVKARVVRVELSSISGTFYGAHVAGLAEVEVIARGEAGP
jgi:WD40-like Beta Propeller Repeat